MPRDLVNEAPVASAGVMATACTRRGVDATREALLVARTRQPGTREGVVKETEAPALWRKPPETATPSTLDKRASPRLYWLDWRDKDFKDLRLVGAGADCGFVAFLLTGCDRNPWANARGSLDPAPFANVRGGRGRHRGPDDPN